MVGSIDPRCETSRGTHRPNPGRVVDWSSRRGNHLGQRSKPTAPTGRTYGCKRSDQTNKPLVPRGPSTYGSRIALADVRLSGTTVEFADSFFKQPKAFPRRDFARVAPSRVPLSDRGRRESRAPTAPVAPCAKTAKECTRFIQVQPGHPGFPRAMVLRLIRALPGEAPFLAPVAGGNSSRRSARVAAPGPHDFAVRCGVFVR
jgi:hypothetical protein